jgi:hypothetical protein
MIDDVMVKRNTIVMPEAICAPTSDVRSFVPLDCLQRITLPLPHAKSDGYSAHDMRSTDDATRSPMRMFPLASFSLPLVLWCVSHPL